MDYSKELKEKALRHLARHGPSTSQELEDALNISQSAVSRLLRGDVDFLALDRLPSLIYSRSQMQRGAGPRTLVASIAENLRIAIITYRKIRAVEPDDTEAIELIAQRLVNNMVAITERIEKQLEGIDVDD